MLQDNKQKGYNESLSPQRRYDVDSSDFKFSIDPEFEVDEAEEELYKKKQQSH